MAKARPKIDPKQLLLNKGEYFALGLAGLFFLILLFSGVSMLADAKDPKEISSNLSKSAQSVKDKIKGTQIAEADLEATVPPAWAMKPNRYLPVPVKDFPLTNPQFDPIAKPDTKKENPTVLAPGQKPFGELQVDLLRVPFPAYDIIPDSSRGDDHYQIAVIVDKSAGKMSNEKLQEFLSQVKKKQSKGKTGSGNPALNPGGFPGGQSGPGAPGGPGGPGGPGAPGGPGGPGMGPGGRQGGMSGFGPGGRPQGMSGQYDQNAKRSATAINYIPLEDLDKEMANGKTPAMTVIPLRGVLIHMEVPYKKQVEELKRALRLNSDEEAMRVGPIYEGYEVERKVSRTLPDGQLEEMIPFTKYNFEDPYQRLIYSKKLEDTIEDGFLSYFIRYEMQLVQPLPKLVTELGRYPEITLPNITAAINKLKKAGLPKVEASEMLSRLSGKKPSNDLYQPQTGNETGAAGLFGNSFNGPGPGKLSSNNPKPNGGNNQEPAPTSDLDYLLLRFIDVDIEPGLTYEYRIRLKMQNPNFEKPDEVGNPEDAKKKVLVSNWTQISDKISIPPENYVFAADVANYRETIDKTYTGPREKDLREKLQVKDNQVVVEMCKWMMEVVVGSGKREPVGAWVVADIPLGRGEFVGRKQYVKLPLWSSETKSYILREINATAMSGKKETNQPKGWIVDFTSPDILVDFTGGKVQTRLGSKNVSEDVDTELLIVSPEGKLTVKKSHEDELDAGRKKIVDVWTKWVSDVENKSKGTAGEDTNTFGGPKGDK